MNPLCRLKNPKVVFKMSLWTSEDRTLKLSQRSPHPRSLNDGEAIAGLLVRIAMYQPARKRSGGRVNAGLIVPVMNAGVMDAEGDWIPSVLRFGVRRTKAPPK